MHQNIIPPVSCHLLHLSIHLKHLAANVLDLGPEAGNLPDTVCNLPRGKTLDHIIQFSETLLQVCSKVCSASLKILATSNNFVIKLNICYLDCFFELNNVVVDILSVAATIFLKTSRASDLLKKSSKLP